MNFSELIQLWLYSRTKATAPAVETPEDHPLGTLELAEAELDATAGAAGKTFNVNCLKTYNNDCYTERCHTKTPPCRPLNARRR